MTKCKGANVIRFHICAPKQRLRQQKILFSSLDGFHWQSTFQIQTTISVSQQQMDKRALLKGWLTLTTVQCITNIVVGLAENNLKHKFYPNATSGTCCLFTFPSAHKLTRHFVDESYRNELQSINCIVASSCNGISSC